MKKRLLATLLCLCLFLTAAPYAAFAEGPTTGTVYGLNEGVPLRVRSAPVDGDVVGQLYNGDAVTILATSDTASDGYVWYQIRSAGGLEGWCRSDFIRIDTPVTPPTPPTPPAEGSTGTVHKLSEGSKLYVRRIADAEGKVLDKLSNGDVVTILGVSDDGQWYQVLTHNNITGWCNPAYIRINKTYETDEAFEAHLTAQGFPEDYKAALRILYAHYPNWVFEAKLLPMTFAEAVAAESEVLKNSLNVNDYPEAWLSMEYGAYNWKTNQYVEMDSGGWVTPTVEITAYFMDPRNFLDFTYVFQFEDQLYSDKHTLTGVQAILPTKYDGYASDVMKAAKDANVSAYFLATRMTQEGSKIDGTWIGDDGISYKGYYNFFNIGAYAGSQYGSYHGAVTNGAIYAKRQGWDSPYKCILGSAQFLGKNYIHKQQNTTYFQKFNVAGENLYNHQYMSNINAPASESLIRSRKATAEELAGGMTFVIPVYKEMPEAPAPKPSETGNNNNFLDSLTVEGFALTPTFDRYTMEYAVEVTKETTEITITATPNSEDVAVTGTGTIQLHTGENLLPVTVTATSGQTRTYTISLFCEADVPEPPDPPVDPPQPPEPPVTPTPSITGNTYTIGDTVTGVEPQTTIADFIAALAVKDGTAKVFAADGTTEKAEGTLVTGDALKVYDNDGKECQSIPVLIYGDVNGDGKISSQDLRRIQRHILGTAPMEGVMLTVADVNRDDKITSQDLRQAQRFILELIASVQPTPPDDPTTE